MTTRIDPPSTAEREAAGRRGSAHPIRVPAIGLTHFAIPLGVSGIAGVWTAAETAVDANEWVADVLWIIAGVLWASFSALYVLQRARTPRTFSAELRHPVIGPFAAYVPVIGLLLLTHFGRYLGDGAPWATWLLVAATLVVAARLLAHWVTGDLSIDHLHPGYFLPVVAGAFVGSIALSSAGQAQAAAAAFGIGVFFWLVIGTVITNRLITRGQLPLPLRPSLSVLLVPPAVGGIAWLLLNGSHPDAVGTAFIGISVVLLLVQLILIPTYLKVPVSMTYWTFTFPIAAASNFGLRWLAISSFAGSKAVSWAIIAIASSLITAIAGVTAVTAVAALRAKQAATEAATASERMERP